ncbi:flagellar biosynthesis protein FlhF [Bacillus sonorensis]|uniref:Flagellar biosynthesis protein FlhF n=2 Tax=Bacillus sonorensis TaxID=119858 RepID=M5P2I1_9BACI|nr:MULTISPECIES: flagellar biosynthesis protein FlhF [Bacillus]TWK71993.1 Flagellar biosynthesis protein FlhF [Bacillus paralicheniformis]ASB89598.1 Flagellar biosynthesis protein FlhF [Bacillus sonorensis]EME74276.1 flagellar biosynthesis regulator FlhF [Bacillus sonorensis L12]MBG9917131.1 flagellar biosynthesis regulator FlhF [Bacillus sonorensis]MCF7618854.1 flagellar biosynthesis protein FlhF [Bacillus sonorensis]
MKIKKFVAGSMQEATKQIRHELGTDAVILNSKKIQTRRFLGLVKKQGVEVIAVVDQDYSDRQKPRRQQLQAAFPNPGTPPEKPVQLELANQVKELKELLETRQHEQPVDVLPEPLKQADRLLTKQGVSAAVRTKAFSRLISSSFQEGEEWTEEKALLRVTDALAELLPENPGEQMAIRSKYVVLFGPTGVGKTTTLAKLAASSVLEENRKIAFITTDTYRIAAVEQLKTYAELLNAPLEVCYTQEEFKAAQQKFADFDHVFIDTAGRNFKDGQYVKELKDIIPFDRGLQAFLVLSATSKYSDMKELVRQFSSVPIDQLIFTKVDETDSLGSVMNLLADSKIGLGYMTNGQNVPEDIRYMSNASFAKLLTGC